ncbi:GH25 family lysozyme [Curtobacterium sp. BH-2-1-1]|uniref:GH25 family lysozyme n=1 Tax=Curtobacterium sp. BH-2-1-1 TaxID=1905847 RepID=UPI0011A74B63|nr:GH25 family lysozyme [Curtobacterium sp. BH-2-1-1]
MRATARRTTTTAVVTAAGLLLAAAVSGPADAASGPTDTTTTTTTTTVASTTSADGDPSIATQDATGNHTMGSSIDAHARNIGAAAGASTLAAPQARAAAGGPPPGKLQGMDVSAWQPDADFRTAYANGARFAYIKASEGTTYTSRTYKDQYFAAAQAGMVRGGYAYAQPSQASGRATADWFFASGGGWSDDDITLPPLLDIEYGSAAQGTCYGLSWGAMRDWIHDFSDRVYERIHRYPAIYTTTDWWKRCTNNSRQFSDNPLFVAIYPVNDFTTPGELGHSWTKWKFWQWRAEGTFPGDQDVYESTIGNLHLFARKHE